MTELLIALSAGAVVVVTEPVTVALLRRSAAIDIPGLRSSHTVPTPRGGGAPIAAGLVVAAVLMHSAPSAAFGVAVVLFAAIGFAEDLYGLSVGQRLALQCSAGIVVACLLVSPVQSVPAKLAVFVAVGAIWIAGVVNVFNFMDGVNGISAAHALIGGVAFACFGAWRADPFLIAAGGAVAACALAFLPWNAFRARVFLGDVGSYTLGAALAVLAGYAVLHGVPAEAAISPLALYLADTVWTLQRRIRGGERWFEGHRTHTYQRWCDVGWSHQRVTVVSAAATVLLCLLGAASLTGQPALRAAADVAGAGLLAIYLRSPELLVRRQSQPEPVLDAHAHSDPLLPAGDRRTAGPVVGAGRNMGGRRGPGDRADRHAQPPHRPGATRLPGRDPAPRTPGRLPGDPHLAVRDAQRGRGPEDRWPSELHDQQRAAGRTVLRTRRHGGRIVTHLLLHRRGLAAGQVEAGPAGRRDPRPVARHFCRARRAD
jgi:UDP-GlcNAc:undecaprenyl-phosphate/decaprenyl-phosphate GlcNAc-1-phosphate transferase